MKYDAEDNEITSEEATEENPIVKFVYEIRIDRLVSSTSFSSIKVAKATSKSDITIEQNVVTSGPPLSGKWKIKCVYEDGTYDHTNPLNMDSSAHTIQRHISEHCIKMRNRILVYTFGDSYSHWNVGR